MTEDVAIPPEVVEAMARAWLKTLCGIETDADWRHWIPEVTAAARAMLAAWPGIKKDPWWDLMTHEKRVRLILPIPPQETKP